MNNKPRRGGTTKRRGRPPVPPEQHAARVSLRMSADEVARLDAAATSLGMKRSQFVQTAIMRAAPKRRLPAATVGLEEAERFVVRISMPRELHERAREAAKRQGPPSVPTWIRIVALAEAARLEKK